MRFKLSTLDFLLSLMPGSHAIAQSAEFAISINDMGMGESIYINDMGVGEAWYLAGACPNASPSRQIYVNDMGIGKAVYLNHMGVGKVVCISNPEYIKQLDSGLKKIFLDQ